MDEYKDDLNIFCIDQKILEHNKLRLLDGDPTLKSSFEKLYALAEFALSQGPFSVTYKTIIPPSGDKHDYISIGPYWWPNPDTEDGLPYIRKDGVVNPEVNKYRDKRELYDFTHLSIVLALAYYFTKEERFAQKVSEWFSVWFLEDSTKMNPNFKYAQGIPGISKGRGIGLIEARHFRLIIETVELIKDSKSFDDDLNDGLYNWFSDYFRWLTTSEEGLDESGSKNNHGSWYDAQAISIALFIGNKEYASNKIDEVKINRIENQIEYDGKQPHELARTKSLSYSTFNLEALLAIAVEADKMDIDLWNYSRPNKGSLRKAVDYLIPFYLKMEPWPFNQISEFEFDRGYTVMLLADNFIDRKEYKEPVNLLEKKYSDRIINLLFNRTE